MTTRDFSGAVRATIVGFLVLCGISTGIAILAAARVIAPETAARALGMVVGGMAILTGNFLPKTRLLQTATGSGTQTRAAERAIGWILVLAGIAFVAAFAFAPLPRAKLLAAGAGIGALILIAATSVQLVVGTLLHYHSTAAEHRDANDRGASPARGRRLMAALLAAFIYVFATASVQLMLEGQPLGDVIASWMQIAFATGFAIFLAFRRCRKERLG